MSEDLPELSIVLPVYNETAVLSQALAALNQWCATLTDDSAHRVEVLWVDGGSSDDTVVLLQAQQQRVIRSPKGRARQMNLGAQQAVGRWLLFLHADTQMPLSADCFMNELRVADQDWGRFDVDISGEHPMLGVIANMMNWRSRLTGVATGDQAMFIRRSVFERLGGFPVLPLMEDVAMSKVLLAVSRPLCLTARVTTSGRRWQHHGIWRTLLVMWWLRFCFWLGVSPDRLARWY